MKEKCQINILKLMHANKRGGKQTNVRVTSNDYSIKIYTADLNSQKIEPNCKAFHGLDKKQHK